jgi:hypothetical protein
LNITQIDGTAWLPGISYFGRSSQRTLCGSDCWQRIVSVTPEEMSAQAFSVAERIAPASLFAFTVLQAEWPE